jgi:DUF971 family protein
MDVPSRVEVRGDAELAITWEDGAVTVVVAATLRAQCPCAICRDPAGMRATERVLDQEEVRIAATRMVGGYALGFTFEPDGHETGIFPFPLLRRIAT